MNRVIEILMKRDGIDEEYAEKLVKETRDEIMCGDIMMADDIIMDYLGLEPDYLEDILYF